jgi:hypothetical protein
MVEQLPPKLRKLLLAASALPMTVILFFGGTIRADEALAPMLNLPETGENPALTNFARLPLLQGEQALVTRVTEPRLFRSHPYLAFYEGKFWCQWSHGPVVEDKPTQHLGYATSPDGLRWSEGARLVGPSPEKGGRYIARGLWGRQGKLTALATFDNVDAASKTKTPWSADLKLLGYEWNSTAQQWGEPQLIFADTLNNFPPKNCRRVD